MSICGLDIGTTGCKAAVYSIDGRLLASAYREYAVSHPRPEWSELKSRQVWTMVCDVLSQAAEQTSSDPIQAISVSSLGEAVVPVTNDRKILDDSILCMDPRGSEYIDQLLKLITADELYKINPNIAGPAYSMPKLRWIKDHQPDIYHKADWFMTWADFACFMLGGAPAACPSLAGRTMLFDLAGSCWSNKLLRLSALDDLAGKLPPITPAGTITGTISSEIATKLGIDNNAKVVLGGHDQCCNALGAGAIQSGQAVYGIGTFECITPVFDQIPDNAKMMAAGLCIENHIMPNKYVTFQYNQGGSLIKWFRDTFAADARDTEDIYHRLADEMPAESTKLFTLPYFEPTGPPNYITQAVGAIIGLRNTTTRGEILRSIMESASYYMAEAIDALKQIEGLPRQFIATGGGAKSDQWLQIKADIFGVPFVRNTTVQCSCLGAAILAGMSTKLITKDAIPQFVQTQKTFEPSQTNHTKYTQSRSEYRKWVKMMLAGCEVEH